ncbi:hypothetical protein PM082_008913 [Marasmius tenuissimus]|nr:hypothetical protein PM082_008913 [Marasmius tenuissimus]
MATTPSLHARDTELAREVTELSLCYYEVPALPFVGIFRGHDTLKYLDLGDEVLKNTILRKYASILHTKTFRNFLHFCGDIGPLVGMMKAKLECPATLRKINVGERDLYSARRLGGLLDTLEISLVRFEKVEEYRVLFEQYSARVGDLGTLVEDLKVLLPSEHMFGAEMRLRGEKVPIETRPKLEDIAY